MSLKMTVTDRRFAPLYWTQFLGALNDNVFKNALVIMVTFKNVTVWGLDKNSVVALAGGLFILPFFLFSALAGQLTDKFEKSRLVRITKYWEVLIMLVAAAGFYTHHFEMLLIVLFLAGTQAAFFGPVKYSILPELVKPDELVAANANVESGTFLAILLGTIGGGTLVSVPNSEFWITLVLLILAVLGVVSALGVPKVYGGAPDLKIEYNPLPGFGSLYRIINSQKAVFNSVLAISWFWFFGAAVLSVLPGFCKDMLNLDEHGVTLFLAMFTIGIGAGAFLCEKLSFGRVELGLVPIGSLGMTVFVGDLYFARPMWEVTGDPITLSAFISTWAGMRMLVDFFLMCVFAGFFILPLYTLIQERSHPDVRSRVIAANNIMNAIFMVVSSVMIMAFHARGMTYPQIFITMAIMNLVVSVYIYGVVPEFTLRFWSWVLARFIYRIRVRGEEHIPKTGPAILVCNHVSYIDWLVVAALVHRPVHFVMHYKFWGFPVIRNLMNQAGVIPIAGKKEDPEMLESAFAKISEALRNDELVCIFPEGAVTRDGTMAAFRPGVERALAADPVPVVPMALRGLWGTWFSFAGGNPFMRWPRHWMAKIELAIGPVVPPNQASAAELEKRVRELCEGEKA